MKNILFVFVVLVASSIESGAQSLYLPNLVSKDWKAFGHFQKVPLKIKTSQTAFTATAHLNPHTGAPAAISEIPQGVPQQDLLQAVLTALYPNGRITIDFTNYKPGAVTPIRFDGQPLKYAWVRVGEIAKGRPAVSLSLPPIVPKIQSFCGKTPCRDGSTPKFALIGRSIVEYREQAIRAGVKRVGFPSASGIRAMNEVIIDAEESPTAKIKQIQIATGSFPDQIRAVGNDVWFTQPSDSLLTRYSPYSRQFTSIKVGPGPDGLGMDRSGKLWFGEYYNRSLGVYDPKTNHYESFPVPDSGTNKPAIPMEDSHGLIWLTDHEANKIRTFDPTTKTFTETPVPTARAWPVDLVQYGESLLMTEVYANKIGVIDIATKTIREIALGVNTLPAFEALVDSKLYVSLWSSGDHSFVELDLKSQAITLYRPKFKTAVSESGIGPVTRDNAGNVYFGALSSGIILKFDPVTRRLTYAKGVTESLKDGSTVTGDGSAWFSGTSKSLFQVIGL